MKVLSSRPAFASTRINIFQK